MGHTTRGAGLAVALWLALASIGCGSDDDGSVCTSAADCRLAERCVNGDCIPADDDAGGADAAGTDSGTIDSGGVDSGNRDSGRPDAGGSDVGPADAPIVETDSPGCVPGCAGDVQVECMDGVETRTMCPEGCRDGECAGCGDTGVVGFPASFVVDLCMGEDDHAVTPGVDCPRSSAGGRDVVLSFGLMTDTTVHIEAEDDDSSASIDPLIYLRRASCDGDQIACGDDDACRMGERCDGSGRTVARAVIDATLGPGLYHLVVEHHVYDAVTCGRVRIEMN